MLKLAEILAQAREARDAGDLTDEGYKAVVEFVRQARKIRRHMAWLELKAAFLRWIAEWRS